MDQLGPFVLIGSDENGRTVEVGLFDDERALRLHAARNTRAGCRYSVWTPRMNGTMSAPAVVGIAWEK